MIRNGSTMSPSLLENKSQEKDNAIYIFSLDPSLPAPTPMISRKLAKGAYKLLIRLINARPTVYSSAFSPFSTKSNSWRVLVVIWTWNFLPQPIVSLWAPPSWFWAKVENPWIGISAFCLPNSSPRESELTSPTYPLQNYVCLWEHLNAFL